MERTRRQQMHSCDACRRRKVRCDSVSKSPCSACVKVGESCRFTVGWRRRRRNQQHGDSSPEATSDHIHVNTSSTSAGGGARGSVSSSSSSRDVTQPPNSSARGAEKTADSSVGRANQSHHSRHPGQPGSTPRRPSSAFPGPAVANSLAMAENSLFRFFREGLSSSSPHWDMFDVPHCVRTVYVGTDISNMTHLIKLNRPTSPAFLIYSHPQVHDPLDWRPGVSEGHGGADDIMGDITSFPAKDIRDDFIEAFFTKIHPYFPVIDEAAFQASYSDPNDQPPLLLLHAVLLVGAHASQHPRSAPSRHTVKAVFFHRTKQVFDMRHENDRLHLVQAALLLTWHLQNGDTVSSNSWFWLGTACRIALGLGVHRNIHDDPLNADRMPILDRRLWRRVWWTLFQTETLSALDHGRPSMLRAEDFDQEPLTLDDFTETDGCINTKVDFEYCVRNIELCHIALDVMALSAPRSKERQHGLEGATSNLSGRLVSWMLDLPSVDEEETGESSFGHFNLRLHYNAVVIHLYRITLTQYPSTGESQHEEAMKISTSAATAIVATFEDIRVSHMMSQCHFTSLMALTAAAIQASRELQAAADSENAMLALNVRQLLDRVCEAAKNLAEFWPNAQGVRKIFKSLLERFTDLLSANSTQWGNSSQREEVWSADLAGMQGNWIDILGPVSWMRGGQGFHGGDVDWHASSFGLGR